MKFFLLSVCLLAATFSFSQDPFTSKDAKQVVDVFFEGLHKGDTLLMKSVMTNNIVMQTVYVNEEGENILNTDDIDGFIKAIGNRPANQKWEERLLDYQIVVDGNLAHVWTPYEFWFNDVFSHCGANSFTIAKLDDGWKIIHLIDSRRKSSCKKE
tara:strand:+ start:21128 stop:21592 length:465 start_codon:yes stop_codon:yes gene_type:complete